MSNTNKILLSVKNLQTCFETGSKTAMAVDGISFDLYKGKTLAIVGESGCGKTVTALSLMRLISPPSGRISGGEILFDGRDLLKLPESEMRKVRGNRISMIFQEPMTSLNPVMTIGNQVMESIILHQGLSKKEAREKAIDMLAQVKLSDPEMRIDEYPHQFSGGMKQRVMIAMALSCEPDLLIADEPTTALDVTVQAQILRLLKELQEQQGTAILLITHDMGVVHEIADYGMVMYAGKIVERTGRDRFFNHYSHPYTNGLFSSLPSMQKRQTELTSIPGMVPNSSFYPAGCRFAKRCRFAFERCEHDEPLLRPIEKNHQIACHLDSPPDPIDLNRQVVIDSEYNKYKQKPSGKKLLFSIDTLRVHYPIKKGLFKKIVGHIKAVDGFTLSINKGETVALVGESGCGKTTVGKGVLRLIDITEGKISYDGIDLLGLPQKQLRKLRKDIQIMFQDPYGSLNPRMMAGQIIAEGLITQRIGNTRVEREEIVSRLMERVGLDSQMVHRYPHEFSGGQRQRIGIARFLAVQPKFVVCDEVTSALDVSVQAQILNLLKTLQREEDLSFLFITHDLSVVGYMADRIAVMYLGKIVEAGTLDDVFLNPKHPYTQALLASSPRIGEKGGKRIVLEGEVPSPSNPPKGCHFHPRCPQAMPTCMKKYPEQRIFSPEHSAACLLY